MLDELPSTLRYDIQIFRYDDVIKSSKFFRGPQGLVTNVIRFFFKKCDYLILLPDDQIITQGEENDKIYLVLEGEMEAVNPDIEKYITLYAGEYFGGIIPRVKQLYDIRAV